MARKSVTAREVKRIKLVERFAKKRNEIKGELSALYANEDLDYQKIEELNLKLNKMPRDSSKVRLQKRCQKCSRARGVWQRFGLCRCCLRFHLMNGDISGGRKSSW